MNELEELKAARAAADVAACDAAWSTYVAARDAYYAELKKLQEENPND